MASAGTEVGYRAWNADLAGDTSVASLLNIGKGHAYTDVFPSLQLRYAIDENTNLRAAFTRGIARPDYQSLIPNFAFTGAVRNSYSQALSAGNPALNPERAWNYDLLAEHYFPSVGVLSGGLFYKDISNFVFDRREVYTGQFEKVSQFLPNDSGSFYIDQPPNGPHAWLYGFEVDYSQHFTFLPGALKGIGFDANWTWVQSRATVPIPDFDSTSYVDANGNTVFPYKSGFRHSPLPRQFPNLFNITLLYDYSAVSARLSGQYTAASIYAYGTDNSSNPTQGTTGIIRTGRSTAHWSGPCTQTRRSRARGNLNNAVFGFFNGLPGNGHAFNIQREYYGTTLFIGVRQGL